MKYKYIGEHHVSLPTIGIEAKPGDVVDVADGIVLPNTFKLLKATAKPESTKEGSDG